MVLGEMAVGEKGKHFLFCSRLPNVGCFPCAKEKGGALMGYTGGAQLELHQPEQKTAVLALELVSFRPALVEDWTQMFLRQALAEWLWHFSCVLLHLAYRQVL